MPELEVEVQLEGHSHIFVVDVESVLEAEQLKGKTMKCRICRLEGKVERVGTPGRKQREPRPPDDRQQSMFKE